MSDNEQHDHDDLIYDDDGWSQPHHHGRAEHFHIHNGPAIYAHDVGYLNYCADLAFGPIVDPAALIGEYGYDITHRH
jgi:hypothetical protein